MNTIGNSFRYQIYKYTSKQKLLCECISVILNECSERRQRHIFQLSSFFSSDLMSNNEW